jgi:quinol monooxygenase YgiN
MELVIFGRFHALPGQEEAIQAAILEVVPPTRAEAGCIAVHAYRSTRDPRLFYIHLRWADEAAFDRHAQEPHTMRFIERARPLIDHELDVARTTLIG